MERRREQSGIVDVLNTLFEDGVSISGDSEFRDPIRVGDRTVKLVYSNTSGILDVSIRRDERENGIFIMAGRKDREGYGSFSIMHIKVGSHAASSTNATLLGSDPEGDRNDLTSELMDALSNILDAAISSALVKRRMRIETVVAEERARRAERVAKASAVLLD